MLNFLWFRAKWTSSYFVDVKTISCRRFHVSHSRWKYFSVRQFCFMKMSYVKKLIFFVQLFFFFHSSFWDILVTFVLCASLIKLFVYDALSIQCRRTFDFNAISISTRVSFTIQSSRLLRECLIKWDLQKFSFIRWCIMTMIRWINANCCAIFRRRRVFMFFFVWSTQNSFRV
jgi:FlaA1/EpsC-like NDP-sugar epimerase